MTTLTAKVDQYNAIARKVSARPRRTFANHAEANHALDRVLAAWDEKKRTIGARSKGKRPKARTTKTMRHGTTRAEILALMADGLPVNAIAERTDVTPSQVMAHAYCNWRDYGVGYHVTDSGDFVALFPKRTSLNDVVS